ncbi:hypothetical protein M3703_07140 [Mannheimia haemolytica]|uniref:hypothetical protein n=1 Tax=Mannheimia haemolytica TaxID=75985 RepID=UPI00201BECBD|nr:hypothetical protein [Mannheimia haemolytica]UQX78659.1 hypothetical protein M3703_07140 [Mannheimia haemolytica]
MLTHRTTLPSGAVIGVFDDTGNGDFFNFLGLPTEQKRHFQAKRQRMQAVKKARKNAKLARRKNR